MRRFYYDLPLDEEDHPEAGDVMVGPRNAYRVVDARPTDSRVWENRWTVFVRPLGPIERRDGLGYPPMPAGGGRHWDFSPYPHGVGPRDHYGEPDGA